MSAKYKLLLFVGILLLFTGCADEKMSPGNETPTRTARSYSTSNTPASTPTIRPPTHTPIPSTLSLTPSLLPPNSTIEHGSPELKFTQLQMFDAKTGWALHIDYLSQEFQDVKILRTGDGGQTWKNVSPPTPAEYGNLPEVAFLDAKTAFAIYSKTLMPTSTDTEITIRRTIDGGQTWQNGDTLILNQAPMMGGSQLVMLDQNHGWMLGTSDEVMGRSSVTLYTTEDGGMYWNAIYNTNTYSQIDDPNTLWAFSNFSYGDRLFTFVTSSIGYYSNGELFQSQDGGISWLKQTLPIPADLLNLDSQIEQNEVFSTISLPRFATPQDGVLTRRFYPRSQVTIPPGSYSGLPMAEYLYFTHDGGQTWTSHPSPTRIGGVYFLDAQAGWFLGKDDANPANFTQLYQTSDGGDTWTQIDASSPLSLGSQIQFIDENTGFAFTPAWAGYVYGDVDRRSNNAKNIYTTTDGGQTWKPITPQLTP